MQNWNVEPERNPHGPVRRYVIRSKDDGMAKGDITLKPDGWWHVELLMVPDLSERWVTLEHAVGYVKGVENTVRLYGKETGRGQMRRAG